MASVIWLRVLFSMWEISIESGALVSLVHKLNRMTNAQRHPCETRARADVHLATWIAGGEQTRTSFFDVVQLFFQNPVRHLRLQQVVDAGSAATSLGAVERDKLITRNRAQHSF